MRYTLLAVAALAIAACEGPVGPEGSQGPEGPEGPQGVPPFAVRVTGPDSMAASFDPETETYYCDMALTAAGEGDGSADWHSGILTFYRYSSTVFTVHHTWTAGELADFWGSATIAGGTSQNSGSWRYSLNEPFRLDWEFRYIGPDGEARQVSHLLVCN